MTPEITEFLQKGRHFRVLHSKGVVLLVEADPVMRHMMKHWATTIGAEIVECCNVTMADKCFQDRIRCLVLGMDGQNPAQAEELLTKVDRDYPATVSLVYTANCAKAFYLQNKMPRITTIVKGDGFEEFLFSLSKEVQAKGAVA